MSTRKIKDATGRQPVSVGSKTRKTTESTKSKVAQAKTRTTNKVSTIKKKEDEEDKNKKKLPLSKGTVTKPSPRITTTQYFPSKTLYSNALKQEKKNSDTSEASSASERPRTATLRKGSIVNQNIAGPEVPKVKKNVVPEAPKIKKTEPAQEPVYEDDFDSYESDFEQYSSSMSPGTTSSETDSSEIKTPPPPKRVSSAGTDDERKLDSGNYDLPESRHRQILDNIKESIEKENANLTKEPSRSHLGSLSDEGFEDGRSLQFINFLGAQQKYKKRKSVELRRKRGEEILSMIRLDHYSFTLYDQPPVPYETFIKNYGRSNTVQMSSQTGEDDVNEEIQTETITYEDKWTQFPPQPIIIGLEEDENFWNHYKCNFMGVGGDELRNVESQKPDDVGLENFLAKTGGLILELQAEANLHRIEESNKSNIPFSKGLISYNTRRHKILADRSINDVSFIYGTTSRIVTVHGGSNKDDFRKSIICLWTLSSVDEPEMLFGAFGEIVCCSVSPECPNIIFGGFDNGFVSVWDFKENVTCHQLVNDGDVLIRTPTFSTEVNNGHNSRIIAIRPLLNQSKDTEFFLGKKPSELCSLDEDGDIIIWGVIFKVSYQNLINQNQGLAHWGSVLLTLNTRISLKDLYRKIDDFRCTDLGISNLDSSRLYISTNYGIIIHCLTTGGRTSVKHFLPKTTTKTNFLELCPFSPEYIMAGFDNGDINFYTRSVEKPLISLSNKDSTEIIQWSLNRPLVFYTKDSANLIHIWNLQKSDLFPVASVPFKENLISMQIVESTDTEKSYMIITADTGIVYIHILNEEYGKQSQDDFVEEKKKFLNYISRYL